MKPPEKPKSLPELFATYPSELPKILAAGITVLSKGKYRHWDKIKHLTPPEGLNHEQWWLGIKLARHQQARETPLQDAQGKAFWYTMPDTVLEMLHKIDSRAGGRIELPEEVTNPDTRDRYLFKSLVEEAITSSQLEGASTTRQVAVDMLRYGRSPKDKSERMIFNNYEAINQIRQIRNQRLTPALVLSLHRTLTAQTLENADAAGRLQTPADERVRVVDNQSHRILHTPPPAEQLVKRLDEMCEFANDAQAHRSFMHPIIRAIVLHFWLAYDHPFEDGNGRTARALFYWAMLSQGYWLFEYVSISRILKKAPARYSESYLYSENDDNDLTYFIIYQLEVMLRAIDELESYLQRKAGEIREIEAALRGTSRFNYRQLALLSHALRHPGTQYTIRSHQTSHNVAYATARSDLLDLTERELLIQQRIDKKTNAFFPAPELRNRLAHAPNEPSLDRP